MRFLATSCDTVNLVSSSNKMTKCRNIKTEIVSNVALNTNNSNCNPYTEQICVFKFQYMFCLVSGCNFMYG